MSRSIQVNRAWNLTFIIYEKPNWDNFVYVYPVQSTLW